MRLGGHASCDSIQCCMHPADRHLPPQLPLQGFSKSPDWLQILANAMVLIHMVSAWQVYAQPVFQTIEDVVLYYFPTLQFSNTNDFVLRLGYRCAARAAARGGHGGAAALLWWGRDDVHPCSSPLGPHVLREAFQATSYVPTRHCRLRTPLAGPPTASLSSLWPACCPSSARSQVRPWQQQEPLAISTGPACRAYCMGQLGAYPTRPRVMQPTRNRRPGRRHHLLADGRGLPYGHVDEGQIAGAARAAADVVRVLADGRRGAGRDRRLGRVDRARRQQLHDLPEAVRAPHLNDPSGGRGGRGVAVTAGPLLLACGFSRPARRSAVLCHINADVCH